jgi:hypothetical protein
MFKLIVGQGCDRISRERTGCRRCTGGKLAGGEAINKSRCNLFGFNKTRSKHFHFNESCGNYSQVPQACFKGATADPAAWQGEVPPGSQP